MPKKRSAGKDDKSDFLFAHNLINRLAVIVGHCDLLKELLAEDPKHMNHVDLIKRNALSIAEDIKDYQRSSATMKRAG